MPDLVPVAATAAALTPVALSLIDKVSQAVGGIALPWQMRRVANAEADATRVKAASDAESLVAATKADIAAADLQARAFNRWAKEQAKHQLAIEEITSKALPHLNSAADPAKVSDDWISGFFDRCKWFTDDRAQELWAKVLAGEANAPGRFSKRTLSVLAGLDSGDCERMVQVCGTIWSVVPALSEPTPYHECPVLHISRPELMPHRIGGLEVARLEEAGLLRHHPSGVHFSGDLSSARRYYFGIEYVNDPTAPSRWPNAFGSWSFTTAGHDISTILERKPIPGFADAVARLMGIAPRSK